MPDALRLPVQLSLECLDTGFIFVPFVIAVMLKFLNHLFDERHVAAHVTQLIQAAVTHTGIKVGQRRIKSYRLTKPPHIDKHITHNIASNILVMNDAKGMKVQPFKITLEQLLIVLNGHDHSLRHSSLN